jgi:hypothetical protein
MELYDIGFLALCGITIYLILVGVSQNILTRYGVGLLISVLALAIIGYYIWASIHVYDAMKATNAISIPVEYERLMQDLLKYIDS